MKVAARRPLMMLVVLMGTSTLAVVGVAIKHRLSLVWALGAFYGALALCQIVYLTIVVTLGTDDAAERSMTDRAGPPLY